MSAVQSTLLKIFILVAFGFGAGWLSNGWRQSAQIEKQKSTQSEKDKSRAETLAKDLDAAQKRGDQLALQVNDLSNTLTLFAEEKNREIARLATGRRCLDAGLVRVLNRSPERQPKAVSETIGEPVRADASTTANPDDGAFATDADVSGWINTCQTRYDTCRARLDAIGQFYEREALDAR